MEPRPRGVFHILVFERDFDWLAMIVQSIVLAVHGCEQWSDSIWNGAG
jgi:hypothetical protein